MDEIQAHLPEEPNSFIGRERELAELRQMLRRTRALTLCGPGGIGKTRLALRFLALAAGEFPDGVWFVELADLQQSDLQQADLVVSRIAAVLGISEEAGRPLLDTLGDALRPRQLLLALDNCEHLLDACAQVGRHLLASAPGLRLLSTSREPLSVAGEMIWRVPPLSVAPASADPAASADAHRYEAIRLFADRAGASRPGFAVGPANVAVVASICRALDGMPLAIELAAARVRALSVEQISARLDDRFGLLTAGDRSAAPRQRTLRAAIEWSYELLTAPERTLFRRLSVFSGWSLEMAEQVCADEDIPAAEVLGLTAALRRGGGQRDPGAELVPGGGRRGSRAADLRRGQPVLDRLGHVRRGRRVAALAAGPGHVRRPGPGPGRGHGGARAAHPAQRSRRRLVAGHRRAEAVPRGRRRVLDGARAEPAQRDKPAHRADRRGRGQRGRGAGPRAGGLRRLERGLRARHPGGHRRPAGQVPRGRAAGHRFGQRDAADRPAVGRRPGPARPRGPGQVPQSPGRGARLVRRSPGPARARKATWPRRGACSATPPSPGYGPAAGR